MASKDANLLTSLRGAEKQKNDSPVEITKHYICSNKTAGSLVIPTKPHIKIKQRLSRTRAPTFAQFQTGRRSMR